MSVLTNPIFLRAGLVLLGAALAFAMAIMIFRRMRRSLVEESSEIAQASPSLEQLPLHTYHAVIQQLKQQKHELTAQQEAERRRVKTTENISAAVLSNLSSGVLFFNTSGLLKQANRAAKSILGYASPVGMSAREVFRNARVDGLGAILISDAVMASLREGTIVRGARAEYVTPNEEQRILQVTLSPVLGATADLLGVACLLTDQTEAAQVERQLQLRGELSAEMALTLRTSLVTISGYAQQLAKNRDPEVAQQLAADIAHEAADLDHKIGGFLAEARVATAGNKS